MKKLLVLFAVLFSASMLVHAEPDQSSPQQNPTVTQGMGNTQQPAAATTQQSPKTDADKMGNGSGDDIDTIDEGDPSHDKDPEADDTSTSPGKS